MISKEGPQEEFPVIEGEIVDAGEEIPEAEQIRVWAAQGKSKRQIEKLVYGSVGGAAYEKVTMVLDGS
jgi:hypothetical protein